MEFYEHKKSAIGEMVAAQRTTFLEFSAILSSCPLFLQTPIKK